MSERLAATTTTNTACMARACAAPHAPFNQRSRHQREKMEPLNCTLGLLRRGRRCKQPTIRCHCRCRAR